MGDETGKKHPILRKIVGELSEREGIILRGDRILVPGELGGDVLDASHKGCAGREAMTRQLRGSVWWPGMETRKADHRELPRMSGITGEKLCSANGRETDPGGGVDRMFSGF